MATDPSVPAPGPVAPSLAGRVLRWRGSGLGRRAGLIVGALLVAAPVATLAGAKLATLRLVETRTAYVAQHRAEMARAAAATAQRRDLSPALAAPGVGATLDALARVLPRETTLNDVARGADGRLTVRALTADPDRLRAALRRDPATAGLRDAGQQRGDGGLIVTLVES